MPNLEESLRDATTRERRCLRSEEDLAGLFSALGTESLRGCALGDAHRPDGEPWFHLRCASDQVATGGARVSFGSGRFTGELEITMGGKNMTFSQRIEGVRRGACRAAE